MKTTRIVIIFVLLSLALTLPVLAAAPPTLSYQGTLTDKAGNPITATRTIVFSLYNVVTGGTATWTETQTLTVTGGRFGAVMGLTSPLDVSLLGGDTWLGIAVQGEPEMTPRQKLTSVAYAMKAQVAETVSSSDSIIPAGTVVAFAGTTAPAGWLMCDGTAVSRTTYARLYADIGNAHGYGDNSTTFNVPDYRGRFLRGVDGAAGNDPDKAGRTAMTTGGNVGNSVGSVQGDAFKSHTHNIDRANGIATYGSGGLNNTGVWDQPSAATGGNETRPKNAYVNWIIKY